MPSVFDVYGIDPDEVAACLLEAHMQSGASAAEAMLAAAEGTEVLAAQEYQPFVLYRLDGGEGQ